MRDQMSELPAYEIISRQGGWAVVWRHLKGRLLQLLTRPAMDVYLRATDIISIDPLVTGAHEQHVVDLFRACAANGYEGFLIDIGANIGLTSCLAVESFSEFYAFEPNPLAFKILEVNVECTRQADKFHLYNFGIGEKDESLALMIPKKNWGGAFLDSIDNSYSADVLLAKDNFVRMDYENYIRKDVKIRAGAEVLGGIFQDLMRRGVDAGVIKIDVEGFELSVLQEISKVLPPSLRAYIIFENWESTLKIEEFAGLFGARATAFRLDWKRPVRGRKRSANIVRFLAGLPFGASSLIFRLEPASSSEVAVGDIVLHVGAAA